MLKSVALRALLAATALAAPVLGGCRKAGGHGVPMAFAGLAAVPSPVGSRVMSLRGGRFPSVAPFSMKAGDLETMVQEKIQSNKAMVFSKSACPFCSKAKKAMDQLDIPYEVMELDKRDDGQDIQDIMLAMTGGRSVPRVFINGQFIGGGDETVAKAASGELKKLYGA